MKRNNKKGFTIVELVIVIAVIAILSTVLIPTFSGVRKSAQDAADLQNARNTYTEYLVHHVDADIDYVKVGDKYYAVDNFEADPVAEDDVADTAVVLDAENPYIATYCADNDNPADSKCDECGVAIP